MMEELIKYLSEKLDVDVSEISPTSHLIDDLDSDDWTNFCLLYTSDAADE